MRGAHTALLGSFSAAGFLPAILLIAAVAALLFLLGRAKGKQAAAPGRQLVYSAAGHTAAECRTLLYRPAEEDLFQYQLQPATDGGLYITFTRHNPTAQPLATMYLLRFDPLLPTARFQLTFVREAFGTPAPILPPTLLDEFFAAKLGAIPTEGGDPF